MSLRSMLGSIVRRTPATEADEQRVLDRMTRILDECEDLDLSNFRACTDHFRKETTVLAQYRTARGHLSHVPEIERTVGLDFACWCGFMTAMMRWLGASRVCGCDIVPEHIEAAQAWTERCGVDGVEFRANTADRVPFDDAAFDWIITSGLYSNLNPAATIPMFESMRRMLKPDGYLLFNDGGNILHGPTEERIRNRYLEVEIGAGTPEAPAGEFFANRLELIRGLRPALDAGEVKALARTTCYMTGPEIETTLSGIDAGNAAPSSVFDREALDRPPIDPITGNAAARANDPFQIRSELEAAGFSVEFTASPGSAVLTEDALCDALGATPAVFIVARPLARGAGPAAG